MHKIIAKTLSTGLKKVIGACIGDIQSECVEYKSILDGPIIINEMCSWDKKAKGKMLLFKVDFNKAFGTVKWKFLDHIQMQMGSSERWRGWIQGYLKSSRELILVNSSSKGEFGIGWGIRQGDPLSLFLFITAMEGLNIAMKRACEKGIFKDSQGLTTLAAPLGCEPSKLPFTYLGV
ncbi:uncharacterized protein LOC122195365 [Lactuca sativa]|uniref:uncharacterized protein LOC122195365 n=1 Tax=Lactuca sativa TaxID=4236 RepID=UPI001C693469|nr:uncharacterized protein LOC122195365 [Lactuca sativa]